MDKNNNDKKMKNQLNALQDSNHCAAASKIISLNRIFLLTLLVVDTVSDLTKERIVDQASNT